VLLLQEIVELRERDVAKRIYINNGLRDLKYKSLYAAKAQNHFMEASAMLMDALKPSKMNDEVVDRLQEAWKYLQHLTSDAKSRERQLEDAQNDLLVLENKLFMKEGEFYGRLRDFTREAFQSTGSAPTDDFTTLSTSSASSASTVSVAHNYYNKVGDINLLRERLYNFDSEHSRKKYIREALRREGQRLVPPSRVFLQQYFDERKAIILDYIAAKEDMEVLRESCMRQGVEVQPPDLPPVLDLSQRINDPPDLSFTQGFRRHISNYDSHTYTHSQQRIDRWIGNVERSTNINPWHLSGQTRKPPLDRASPISAPEIPGWTSQPIEDYPALSSYNRIQSSTSDSTADTEVPEGIERRSAMIRYDPTTFEGQAPLRRYSCSDLSLSSALMTPLNNQNLQGIQKGHFDVPCETCFVDGPAKSIDLPRM
jgi:hypothetical protein